MSVETTIFTHNDGRSRYNMCVIHVNGRLVSGRRYVINVNHAWRGNRSGAILLVSCDGRERGVSTEPAAPAVLWLKQASSLVKTQTHLPSLVGLACCGENFAVGNTRGRLSARGIARTSSVRPPNYANLSADVRRSLLARVHGGFEISPDACDSSVVAMKFSPLQSCCRTPYALLNDPLTIYRMLSIGTRF